MEQIAVEQMTCARIPTDQGEWQLCLYRSNRDDKEHLALVLGAVAGREEVLVRLHSECFTGDVLGSLRCDCGEQLSRAMERVAGAGAGIILYLRQEGRGIGLLDKLRAYNLQDQGYDTVEANLMLGHQADEREYSVAAAILRHLDVRSLALLTNNPSKVESLESLGLRVARRVSMPPTVNRENADYLATKVARMRHLLDLGPGDTALGDNGASVDLAVALTPGAAPTDRPFVSLTYAQSLDGSLTVRRGEPLALSGPESLRLTHQLRAAHDAILVGIGTVLADDPRLTVRQVEGADPRPVVLDSHLRLPPTAALLRGRRRPIVATTPAAALPAEAELVARGAEVVRLPAGPAGRVDLVALLRWLRSRGLLSLMVEGGAEVITAFLEARLVDRLAVTIAPVLVGGLSAVGALPARPRLRAPRQRQLGQDVVIWGDLA